ncbi:MAG: cell division protein FtsA [Prevotellaceae bacterium]|nr:cell division protein FtsA [Prevotella sp.]MDD7530526.1 cell division protein FtsA [Prevotellaceae bacterium]MDY2634546.1 cell division protein FtsA [Prevotella sp.]
MPAKEFIVAIELGSSKITGIAGKKNNDGSISVLHVVTEDSSSFIRKGIIYNIDKTGACLAEIINKLKAALKSEISHIYVGVGGQSIRSVRNVIVKEMDGDGAIITQDMVNELMDANRSMIYPDQEILDAVTQEYKVDAQYQLDPVGVQCKRLEGNFLNILWRKAFYRKLNQCFDNAGIAICEMFLAPMAMADSVLTEAEKRVGCVLIDLGAETTTVSVYFKNILRHLVVIPLGGNNITKDIASQQIEEGDAEKMKLKYASAYTANGDIDKEQSYPIDKERSIDSLLFVEIVEARMEEIIVNAWNQVPAEYKGKLLGGIILTGGGSNMKNIERAFHNHTNVDKIRVAGFVRQVIHSSHPAIEARNGSMNTILGLLAKGNMNCAGPDLKSGGDLFGTNKPTVLSTTDIHSSPRQANEIETGVVMTAAEREKAEEEAIRKAEEEERKRLEEEELKKKEEEEKKKNSIFNRVKKMFENIGKTMMDTDPE